MSIGPDILMALLQTTRQGLKHDSLTSIVSTSDGSIGVAVEKASGCVRAAAYCMRARDSRSVINTKLTLKNKN